MIEEKLAPINEVEEGQLEEMKGMAKTSGVEELNDGDLIRFLEGCNWKVEKAFEMYMAQREWFAKIRPDLITAEEIRGELERGIFYFTRRDATDRDGHLLAFVDTTKYNKKEIPFHQVALFVLFFMEECIRRMGGKIRKISIVVNMKGLKWSHFYDAFTFEELEKWLTDNYCERLSDAYLVSTPGVFKAFWNIVKPLVDSATRKKIHVVKRKRVYKFVDPKFLPVSMGGLCPDFNLDQWMAEIGLEGPNDVDTSNPINTPSKGEILSEDQRDGDGNEANDANTQSSEVPPFSN